MSVLRITSELFIMIIRHTSIELDFSTKQAEKIKSREMKVDSSGLSKETPPDQGQESRQLRKEI